ncbi:MAG: hypothetical protein KAQ75_03355 [Bacteroidales bacterium]|nr:hypothetical protein [Bacteroidales bacterium]
MKLIKITIVLLAIFISNSYAGKKVTIIELINNTETIQVYFYNSQLTVKQPDVSATVSLYPEEAKALKTKFESIDLPEDYASIYSAVIDELNKVFGVEKFVLGNLDDVPKKTVKIFGADTEVEDWNQLSDKFIVNATVDVKYTSGVSSYKRVEDIINIDSYLEASINLRFCEIVEEKAPLKYLNPAGVNIYVKGDDLVKQKGIYTTMEQFTEKVAPNSLVDKLKETVPGSLDKFYAKQKKKYDKANK